MSVELTDRDIHLVVMLARGYTTDRIARATRLSRHTVAERISLLLERFKCRNRTELVAYCYVYGPLLPGIWPPDNVSGSSRDDVAPDPCRNQPTTVTTQWDEAWQPALGSASASTRRGD